MKDNPTDYICKHCNQSKGKHKALTLQCPVYIGRFINNWSNTTIYYPKQYKEGLEVKEEYGNNN